MISFIGEGAYDAVEKLTESIQIHLKFSPSFQTTLIFAYIILSLYYSNFVKFVMFEIIIFQLR